MFSLAHAQENCCTTNDIDPFPTEATLARSPVVFWEVGIDRSISLLKTALASMRVISDLMPLILMGVAVYFFFKWVARDADR